MIPIGSRGRSTQAVAGYRRDTGGGDGGGGGTAADRFYTNGPPTRSGTTITYPDDGHSSIEAAVAALNSGDELYIQTGTYNETMDLRNINLADHITIRGDLQLSFDARGKASVAQEGPTITNAGAVFRTDHLGWGTDVGLSSDVSPGDKVLDVTDASLFSPDDAIHVAESGTRPFNEPQAGGAAGASSTVEFATVESVDTAADTITVQHPVHLPYPRNNSAGVGLAPFEVRDLRISGLRFDGQSSGQRAARFYSIRDGWFDNIIARDVGDDNLMTARKSYHCRWDGFHLENGGHYGLNIADISTDNMVTNASSQDHVRYTVRYGPISQPASGGYVDGIYGQNLNRTVGGVHHGGFDVDYKNLHANNARVIVTRSRNLSLDGFELSQGRVNDNDNTLICSQRPANVVVKNGTISNKDSNYTFQFRLRDTTSKPNERIDNVTYENIDIEHYGPAITDIGRFEIEGSPEPSGPLTFRNITYGGQQLTYSDVTSWNGYNSTVIPDLTVE